MKKRTHQILFILLLLMSCITTRAHDIAVANSDGVTIYYLWMNDKTELAVTYRGSSYGSYWDEYSGSVVIPESVTYGGQTYPVTSISGYAFNGCTGLTAVTIPNSVTSIGSYAFRNSPGLTAVTIPNSVTSIGEYAFMACTGLTAVTIGSGVTSIGKYAFSNCTGLEKVIVKDLAAWCNIAFYSNSNFNCDNPLYYAHHLYSDENTEITDLVIPDGVTTIKRYAFYGCSGLNSVTLPESVTSIGSYAFYYCIGLTSVTIPNSVTSIGQWAFEGCI